VLCVVVDAVGWPIAWEIYPGNTADPVALNHTVALLRERFDIRSAVVVADRGMISRATIEMLTGHASAPFRYVLGCRMRKSREIQAHVLGHPGSFEAVEDNLAVKEVVVEGRRYVVCRNPFEAQKDAEVREALVKKIQAALAHGPKQLVGNKVRCVRKPGPLRTCGARASVATPGAGRRHGDGYEEPEEVGRAQAEAGDARGSAGGAGGGGGGRGCTLAYQIKNPSMAAFPAITKMNRFRGSVLQPDGREVRQRLTPPCEEQVPEPTDPLTQPSRQIAPIRGPHSVLRRIA
jgi:hypothetical protein